MGRIRAPSGALSLWRPAHTAAEMHGDTNSRLRAPWPQAHGDTETLVVTTPGVCPKLGPLQSGVRPVMQHSVPQFPPRVCCFPPRVKFIGVCQRRPGQQCGTAAPSLGTSGTPNAPHTTPLMQPPADVRGDATDPAQKKKKKAERGGKKTPTINQPHGKAEGADGPRLRGPRAAGSSGFTLPTRHQARVGHCGNSKFQMALFGWVFFFFLASFPRQQDSLSSASCHRDFT